MHTRSLRTSLILLALVMSVHAQQPQPSTPVPSQSKPAASPQKAETDEAQDVVRITTNLVQVDAVVLKDGKQVTDLKAEDFELFEDGRPQPITSFSYFSNIPTAPLNSLAPGPRDKNGVPVVPTPVQPHDVRRTVALVVDDLGMSFESMAHARKQLRKFIDEQLQPNDLVAIIRTGGEVGSLQQFTTDRRLLTSALDHLKWNPCSRAGVHIFPPVGSPNFGSGVDADSGPCGIQRTNSTLRTLQFVLKGMSDLPGRKSMVVFSESLPIQQQEPGRLNLGTDREDVGDDDGSFDNSYSNLAALQKVAELAIRGSVVIYAVDTRGLQYTGPTAADNFSSAANPGAAARQMQTIMRTRSAMLLRGREGADLIARQTGGFLVRDSNDFGLKRVMDDQKGYYLLGYRPGDETFNRRFHHLKVRVKRRGLTVRTREGFYGVSEDEARPPELTARAQMDKALISPFGANEVPVRLSTFFANDAAKGSLLRTFLYLNPRDFNFTDQPDGTRETVFDLDTILFGDNGRVVNREDKTVTLRLGKVTYDRVQRDGMVYGFDMPVKQPGSFQFRVAVRDTISSHIGAAGQFIEVPKVGSASLALSGIFVRGVPKALNRPVTEGPSPSASRSPAPNSTEQAKTVEEMASGPGLRRFHQGTKLVFVYAIYNAVVDDTTHLPKLTTQTLVFRDGKPIFTGDMVPLEVKGQRDLLRLTNGAELLLGPELTPGEYVLQIVVEDQLAKEKRRSATQWIDFEVVK